MATGYYPNPLLMTQSFFMPLIATLPKLSLLFVLVLTLFCVNLKLMKLEKYCCTYFLSFKCARFSITILVKFTKLN